MNIKEKSTEADTVDCSANGYSIPFFLSGTYWFFFFFNFQKKAYSSERSRSKEKYFGVLANQGLAFPLQVTDLDTAWVSNAGQGDLGMPRAR